MILIACQIFGTARDASGQITGQFAGRLESRAVRVLIQVLRQGTPNKL
ncbi:MAG: hypothetical protein V2J42_06505 [Wenzhouxiangella sp.]|nr:hypothetical protein [Wenzhouxiangella sp.]